MMSIRDWIASVEMVIEVRIKCGQASLAQTCMALQLPFLFANFAPISDSCEKNRIIICRNCADRLL